ncbi:Lipopolysaccharide export system ATP-binding protein LptB [Aquicella siphonis]|uniref:Lipopolysaccharide export system ATP-binding protein LptB n=1 Tax=Aquicella siphonis TaxID=254247 RepID=A0A5E4PGW4_9COXI|nr:LPS export ABC transporter ATP-binding protein [Aquicella siphonis]VVC76124.1 Lipopolysaccharide export system ATP-binding protein LptB [Aquicella siphonis]
MSNTLRAQHLSKKYKSRDVVKDVSLQIKRGEVVGLLGPNGAGKTTSFYMIVGLIPVDGGSIHLDDQDITRLPVHARARLGISYLPQEASIFRKLTVAQNIMAILELRQDLNKSERKLMLEHLLEEFRISHIRDTVGISLSGGERRRAEIARALATEPKFILLDEPFAGIDPISVLDVKRIINHLRKRGIGILITDHNVRDTLNICERAYIVNQGRIICEGNPETVLMNNEVRTVYLGEEFNL